MRIGTNLGEKIAEAQGRARPALRDGVVIHAKRPQPAAAPVQGAAAPQIPDKIGDKNLEGCPNTPQRREKMENETTTEEVRRVQPDPMDALARRAVALLGEVESAVAAHEAAAAEISKEIREIRKDVKKSLRVSYADRRAEARRATGALTGAILGGGAATAAAAFVPETPLGVSEVAAIGAGGALAGAGVGLLVAVLTEDGDEKDDKKKKKGKKKKEEEEEEEE